MSENSKIILIKNKLYRFDTYDESELTVGQLDAIHKGLNLAYGYRTQSFVSKPYGRCAPLKRITCTLQDKLIGHIAVFQDYVTLSDEKIKIGGVGLTFSLRPLAGLGFILRQLAVELCSKEGVPLAMGRVRNTARIKKNIGPLVSYFLHIPLIGTTTRSHDWETLAIYKTSSDTNLVAKLIADFQKKGYVKIDGEIF